MERVLDKMTDCCGCGACLQVCPAKAISLEEDSFGFRYSKIDSSLCVDCGKCKRVCPAINSEERGSIPRVFSAYAKSQEKRGRGSSGGVFGLLAEKVINSGGVVYGAAFDDNLKIRHIGVTSLQELAPVLKSKYVQSDVGNTFLHVQKNLKEGKTVLFCGTPCQCLALNNLIGGNRERLMLVDFICHGVPSQKMFDNAVASWQNSHNKKIEKFSFRHKSLIDSKESGLRHWKLTTSDGKLHSGRSIKFPFYYAYLQYLFFRPSCYSCRYAKTDRVTDLTLGDFWGLRKIECDITMKDFNKGFSMVMANNARGQRFLDSLEIGTKEYPLAVAIDNNFAYTKATIQTEESKQFFKDYSTMSWAKLEKKYMIVKTDIFHRGLRFVGRQVKKVLSR